MKAAQAGRFFSPASLLHSQAEQDTMAFTSIYSREREREREAVKLTRRERGRAAYGSYECFIPHLNSLLCPVFVSIWFYFTIESLYIKISSTQNTLFVPHGNLCTRRQFNKKYLAQFKHLSEQSFSLSQSGIFSIRIFKPETCLDRTLNIKALKMSIPAALYLFKQQNVRDSEGFRCTQDSG